MWSGISFSRSALGTNSVCRMMDILWLLPHLRGTGRLACLTNSKHLYHHIASDNRHPSFDRLPVSFELILPAPWTGPLTRQLQSARFVPSIMLLPSANKTIESADTLAQSSASSPPAGLQQLPSRWRQKGNSRGNLRRHEKDSHLTSTRRSEPLPPLSSTLPVLAVRLIAASSRFETSTFFRPATF
jgi:hypothetical protein